MFVNEKRRRNITLNKIQYVVYFICYRYRKTWDYVLKNIRVIYVSNKILNLNKKMNIVIKKKKKK